MHRVDTWTGAGVVDVLTEDLIRREPSTTPTCFARWGSAGSIKQNPYLLPLAR